MTTATFRTITDLLDGYGISYRQVHHEPTSTSAASAKARGEDLSIGGKAILLKVGSSFKLFVLSAALRLDSARIKERFRARKLRFATPGELLELTGLVPGSVPPFGEPILPFELYVDHSITKNQRIAFNAGSLTDSIVMKVDDYLKIASPRAFAFSTED